MNKLQKITSEIFKNFYLVELKRTQWKPLNYLRNMQFKKLRAIIKYAYDYVRYYHDLLRSVKIKPEDIKTFDDLKKSL